MATHSNMLAWEFPGQRSRRGYCPQGRQDLDTTEQLKKKLHLGDVGYVIKDIKDDMQNV